MDDHPPVERLLMDQITDAMLERLAEEPVFDSQTLARLSQLADQKKLTQWTNVWRAIQIKSDGGVS
jgi:hypothetical protein